MKNGHANADTQEAATSEYPMVIKEERTSSSEADEEIQDPSALVSVSWTIMSLMNPTRAITEENIPQASLMFSLTSPDQETIFSLRCVAFVSDSRLWIPHGGDFFLLHCPLCLVPQWLGLVINLLLWPLLQWILSQWLMSQQRLSQWSLLPWLLTQWLLSQWFMSLWLVTVTSLSVTLAAVTLVSITYVKVIFVIATVVSDFCLSVVTNVSVTFLTVAFVTLALVTVTCS